MGRLIAVRAAHELRPAVRAVLPDDTSELLDAWAGSELAVVVDAVRSGSPPGTVRCLEIGGDDLVLATATSSHTLGLGAALRLSRSLGAAPRRAVLVGVEGAEFAPGDHLSEPVAAAVPAAVAAVVDLLSGAGRGGPPPRWRTPAAHLPGTRGRGSG